MVADATTIAQKILSCVFRVKQRFGAGHVISVLRGENTDRVRSLGHDRLSTYGLLADHPQTELRDWIYQLIGHGFLMQDGDKYPVLRLTESSSRVLKGEESVRLVQIARKERQAQVEERDEGWEGVDQSLFEAPGRCAAPAPPAASTPSHPRRRSLREIARAQPKTLLELREIYASATRSSRLGDRILGVVSSV